VDGLLSNTVRDLAAIIGILLAVIQILLAFLLRNNKTDSTRAPGIGAKFRQTQSTPEFITTFPMLSVQEWLGIFFITLVLMLPCAYLLRSLGFPCNVHSECSLYQYFIGLPMVLVIVFCSTIQTILLTIFLVQIRLQLLKFHNLILRILAGPGEGSLFYGAIGLIALITMINLDPDNKLYQGNWLEYLISCYLAMIVFWSFSVLVISTVASIVELFQWITRKG
jgi:hypothetical protein